MRLSEGITATVILAAVLGGCRINDETAQAKADCRDQFATFWASVDAGKPIYPDESCVDLLPSEADPNMIPPENREEREEGPVLDLCEKVERQLRAKGIECSTPSKEENGSTSMLCKDLGDPGTDQYSSGYPVPCLPGSM